MTSMEMVAEFHRLFGQTIAHRPNVNDGRLNELRIELIAEELRELARALGGSMRTTLLMTEDDETRERLGYKVDPVATFDALLDLQYVLDGAFLSLGFHRYKDAGMAAVHESNLRKLVNGVVLRRRDGKVTKPDGWQPPNLTAVLNADQTRACVCHPASRCGRCDDVDSLFDGTELEVVR